jgi:hypothetical protein
MSQYLGLSSVGQWPFFNRLIKVGLVYKTNVATIKEKVFLLTREGGELAGILADGEKTRPTYHEKIMIAKTIKRFNSLSSELKAMVALFWVYDFAQVIIWIFHNLKTE